MLRTFNCGFGMAVFVSAETRAEACDALALAGLVAGVDRRTVPARTSPPSLTGRSSCDPPGANGGSYVGRGSNMSALIEAAGHRDFPPMSCLCCRTSRRRGPRGCSQGGDAAEALDFRCFSGKEAFEGARRAASRRRGRNVCLAGFMRILSPPFVERWEAECSTFIPRCCPLARASHASAGARPGDVEPDVRYILLGRTRCSPIVAQARVRVLPGDDVDALAARVLIEEHRIYPRRWMRSLARSAPPALPKP